MDQHNSYDAFISYSRAADDDLAPDLQRGLERLSKPWYQRRPFLRILRDTTSFGASADLTQTITSALDESGHLVLLISPESARSRWTTQEVEHWMRTKGSDTITRVITGWERDADLPVGQLTDLNEFDWNGPDVPPALRGLEDAPLAVDLRWADGAVPRSLDDPRWRDAVAQIAAGIKGVKKDELIGELVTMRQRARIITSTLVTSAAILLGVLVMSLVLWLLAARERDDAIAARDTANEAADAAEVRRTEAEAEALEAVAKRLEAEAAEAEARAAQLEAQALQAEAEGQRDEAERLRGEAEAERDNAAAARDEAAAERDAAQEQRDAAFDDKLAAEADAEASRLQAATEELIAESRRLAALAADLADDDVPAAVAGALESHDAALGAAANQPDETFATGDQQAIGTLFDVLRRHRHLVGVVSGEFATVAADTSGSIGAAGVTGRGVVLFDASTGIPADRPAVPGSVPAVFPGGDRFVVLDGTQLSVYAVPTSLDQPPPLLATLSWPGPGVLRDLAVSASGDHVVAGTDRGALALWRVDRTDPVAELPLGLDYVDALDVDPRTGLIAWGGVGPSGAGLARIDGDALVDAGSLVVDPGVHVLDLAFQPCTTDSCALVVAERGRTVRVWNVDPSGGVAPREECVQECPPAGAALAWRGDGGQLAIGTEEGTIEFWSAAEQGLADVGAGVVNPGLGVVSVAYVGGDLVNTSETPTDLYRWRADAWAPHVTASRLGTERSVILNLNTVAEVPGGDLFATGGEDGAVRLWRPTASGPVEVGLWAPWCAGTCTPGETRQTSALAPDTVCQDVHRERIADLNAVATGDGRAFLAASTGHISDRCPPGSGGSVLLFEVTDGSLGSPTTLVAESGAFLDAVAFDHTGCAGGGTCTLAAGGLRRGTGSGGAHLWVWNLRDGAAAPTAGPTRVGSDSESTVTSLAFTAQEVAGSRALLVGDRDGSVRAWAVSDATGVDPNLEPVRSMQALAGTVHVAIGSPVDPDLLLVGGAGGEATLWDTSGDSPVVVSTLARAADFVSDATWTSDGRTVVVSSADGDLRLVDVTVPSSPSPRSAPITDHVGAVRGVASSTDGARMVSVSDQGAVDGAIGTIATWTLGSAALRSIACDAVQPRPAPCEDP